MAIWLKAVNVRLNLNNVTSVQKTTVQNDVYLDIKSTSGDVTTIPMIDSAAADELINIITDTINAGGDVTIDTTPFEKV